MQIVNISERDIIRGLDSPSIYGKYWGDYYRKFTEYDKDNILGLYYKKIDLKNYDSLDESIKTIKECTENEYTWEHYSMCRLFSLVNRLEEAYNIIERRHMSNIKAPSITGIALYKNYPVGTLFPRELLEYDRANELDDDERAVIMEEAKYFVDLLMKKDVYPIGLYRGNIVVKHDDFSDVRLDGLDGPMVSRVESKDYVKTLKKRGRDLRRETLDNFENLR